MNSLATSMKMLPSLNSEEISRLNTFEFGVLISWTLDYPNTVDALTRAALTVELNRRGRKNFHPSFGQIYQVAAKARGLSDVSHLDSFSV